MKDNSSDTSRVTLTEMVQDLMEQREQHSEEWLREQLAVLDDERRENHGSVFSDLFGEDGFPDDIDITITPPGTTKNREYDADWDPSFQGWSGCSKPKRSNQEGGFLRRFTWQFRGDYETWEMEVPGHLFEYYTERTRTRNFGTYIGDPFDKPFLSQLANRIRSFGEKVGLSQREQINAAMRFVQSLEYTPDDVTMGQMEYPKYPIETLVHDGGDCEDTSILLGGILRELGCEVALLVLPNHHHMMLGVAPSIDADGAYFEHNGTKYYTLEATGHGWDLGEMPRQYQNASAQVYPVGKDPILVHEWEATPQSDGSVEVSVHVANFGDAPAENLDVIVEFQDDDDTMLARERLAGDVELLQSNTKQLDSQVLLPDDRRIQGRCVLSIGYLPHDVSSSEFHG
ncbi:hypothetical protein [Halorubellus salinus]|uniref:hypothetical protein n=1 Tax=Halorubellus salinus TaxID=755309 RepID=UPI001D068285|nr:hypothetical protein [Halorubellus salinus]